LMDAGDFRTPFILMAGCYLVANLLFWKFFAGWEQDKIALVPAMDSADVIVSGD